jgi:hypothetical protein
MMSIARTDIAPLKSIRGGRPFSRMMEGLVAALSRRDPEPKPPAPLPSGPAAQAMIDADFERMASFGSWESLRDDLRARSGDRPRRSA